MKYPISLLCHPELVQWAIYDLCTKGLGLIPPNECKKGYTETAFKKPYSYVLLDVGSHRQDDLHRKE
jgi:hypothetical protein